MNSKKNKKIVRYDKYGYYFVLPFIIGFLIFQLYPIIYTFNLSFTDLAGWNTEYNYILFENFTNLMKNQLFQKSIINTIIIWGISFIPEVVVALILAVWFTGVKIKVKGQGLYKTLFYLPGIITAASVSVLFVAFFGYPDGAINSLLVSAGIIEVPFEFFRNETASRLIVSFIQFWMFYGSTMIMFIAAITAIDVSLYEAAMIDGATNFKAFKFITIPLIKPITLYILVTSLIGGFQIFDIPFLITNGQGAPNNSLLTMNMFIYNQAFTGGRNFGIASAASIILLLIIAFCSLFLFRYLREDQD